MTMIIDGSNGATFPDSSLQAAAASPFVLKNRIINGAMVIDQRNAGASVTPSTGTYTLDRWQAYSSQASKFTVQQNASSVTPPAGFTNYLGCTSSSAYSVGASETFVVFQYIEGFNTADLGFGTANAKTVTLSFWVRSSLTGTFGGAFRNSAENRSYPFSYTISSANTWEQKSITIAGDTTGTWVGATNGTGLGVLFSIGTGSNLSGTAGAWAGANYISATGATSVVGTNGATFYITGVQLEIGSTATPFERRLYNQELALCQRYTYALPALPPNTSTGTQFFMSPATFGSATNGFVGNNFPVQMRTTPSLTATAGNYQVYLVNGGTYQTLTSISLNGVTSHNFYLINFGIASGGTAGQACYLNTTTTNGTPLILSAEL